MPESPQTCIICRSLTIGKRVYSRCVYYCLGLKKELHVNEIDKENVCPEFERL